MNLIPNFYVKLLASSQIDSFIKKLLLFKEWNDLRTPTCGTRATLLEGRI